VGRLGVLALVLATRIAYADDAQSKADVFFQKGQQDYQNNKFQAAIELFKDAYELVHDPVYLFNIAQSYRKAADCINAQDYYFKYLQESPAAPNADVVKQWMRELQPCVDQQKKREIEAAKRAEELARRDRDAKESPATAAPVAPTVEQDDGAGLRTAGFMAMGVGGVGLVIGVTESVRGSSLQSGLKAACQTSCTYDQIKSLDDAGKRANTIAAVGYISGGVALAAGIGLYFYGRSKVEHVVVAPAPGGATVGATFNW